MPSSREFTRQLYAQLKDLGICPKCRKRDRADEWSVYCGPCKNYQTYYNDSHRRLEATKGVK